MKCKARIFLAGAPELGELAQSQAPASTCAEAQNPGCCLPWPGAEDP